MSSDDRDSDDVVGRCSSAPSDRDLVSLIFGRYPLLGGVALVVFGIFGLHQWNLGLALALNVVGVVLIAVGVFFMYPGAANFLRKRDDYDEPISHGSGD